MAEILLFVLAFFSRLFARRGLPQDFNSHGHLYFAQEVKRQRVGPFGSISTKVVDGVDFSAPFMWHWLVSFFSILIVSKYQKYWNPLIGACFSVSIYYIAIAIGLPKEGALISFAIYVFTPMWFSRLAMGPRIRSFTPRLSGEVATNFFFVATCLPLGLPAWAVLLLAAILACYVLSSSKLGVQAMLLLSPLVSLFSMSWLPVTGFVLGIVLVGMLSKGTFLNSLMQQLTHLRWYFLKNQNGGMAVSGRNSFDENYRRRSGEGMAHHVTRVIVLLTRRNSYTGVLIKLPALPLVLSAWFLYDGGVLPSGLIAPVLAASVVYLLINLPPILFLGEAERYLNHVAIFIVLAIAWYALQLGYLHYLWLVVGYGTVYFLVEGLVLPRVNKTVGLDERDSNTIIAYLSDQTPTTVLGFPYHAGGGVYRTAEEPGRIKFPEIVEQIKRSGRGKKYDCVIGVSGGTDSSYLVYLAKEMGLRPLAVHYDNTWNSAIATQNIRKVLQALDVDLYTHVIDNKESDDIFKAFFLSGVAEIEGATDLALAEVKYRAAWKYGVKYVLEGHSFVTEGITPVGRNYFDGQYIQSIHRAYGSLPMKTYPLMTFSRFLWWSTVARIRKIRPFWYIDYTKEEARSFLEREFGWDYYGGHHLENRMTAFYQGIYLPQKFDTDLRNNTLSALARMGRKSRQDAWAEYNTPPTVEDELLAYFKKRLELSDKQYATTMSKTPRSWYEFPTYKLRFERLRPLFSMLAKASLVPMSFYLKYCFPAGPQS